MSERSITRWLPSGQMEQWQPTTLDKIGKLEEFLEDVLEKSPELLRLESRRTGVRGPFKSFRQVSMQTPSGRGIYPDIVMFAASGHVIVIEVKRYINPELKDRSVIAQIIDYASSFAVLTEKECVRLFSEDGIGTWTDCIEAMFPDDPSPEELADVLFGRIQRGELNLAIACDKIPSGLPDVVSGIASQSTLGFDLDLVEVVPHVREISDEAEIIFVPSTRVATEIVSRTAITITHREGDAEPSTQVQITSLEEIKVGIEKGKRGSNPDARSWTVEEVEEECRSSDHSVALKLLDFAKHHSADGLCVTPAKKLNASFGFYVMGLRDGIPSKKMIFNCVVKWGGPTLYLKSSEPIVSAGTMSELRRRLKATFGDDIDADAKEPGVSYEVVEKHLDEFKDTILWFKSQAEIKQND